VKIFFYYLVLVFTLYGCSRPNEPIKSVSSAKSEYFKSTFIKKFKTLQLPCSLPEGIAINSKDFAWSDPESHDSLFFGKYPVLYYGMLEDTTEFITLIMYTPGLTLIPLIWTFDKSGNSISSENIDFGCWDGGPGDYYCEGAITIDKKLKIALEHTTICTDCDSTSTNILKFVNTRSGQINKTGVIELGERISKDPVASPAEH
jgi:hypothetical protein